jgi:anti-sigma28 factor (negative regulator of flagellin synthesis)
MSDINPVTRTTPPAYESASKAKPISSDAGSATRTSDRVELSDQARLLSKLKQLPEVREGLVNTVKAQIEAGTYDTAERFDTAVNALLDDLSS